MAEFQHCATCCCADAASAKRPNGAGSIYRVRRGRRVFWVVAFTDRRLPKRLYVYVRTRLEAERQVEQLKQRYA